jgi:dTDP-4-dehydrorhamnose reductase
LEKRSEFNLGLTGNWYMEATALPHMIVGAKGMLGTDLLALLEARGVRTVALDVDEIDIGDPGSVAAAIDRFRPGLIVNTAAITDVDGCESNEETALRVNSQGPGHLADACKRSGVFLVHLSTDYVFDGTKRSTYMEDDPINPLGVYGRTKAQGEAIVRATLPGSHLIVRTQWLFGLSGKNFVETILRLAEQRDEISVVNDQWGSPTYTVDLSLALIGLLDAGERGTFHATNAGETTWYDFAARIIELAGIKGVRVRPISTEQLGRPAPRPPYSVLDNTRFIEAVGSPLRNWDHALQDYLLTRSRI